MYQAGGYQALTQGGYRFGFEDDVLIPATKLLGCSDFNATDGFRIGRSEKHAGIEVGAWRLALRIQEGRFPKLDQILPSGATVKSTLEITSDDARFLADAIPRLPYHDGLHQPITIDLNGKVLVRCRETETARPTELQLSASQLVGDPIVLNTNRRYVERALRLGFRSVGLFGPESPALCVDDRRRYLWMLLDKGSIIPRHDDPIRIAPGPRETPSTSRRPRPVSPNHQPHPPSEVSVSPTTQQEPVTAKTNGATTVKRGRSRPSASAIEQATALRDAMRTVAAQAGELVRSLKQQRRQAKIVETTLASLKQLQKVAG